MVVSSDNHEPSPNLQRPSFNPEPQMPRCVENTQQNPVAADPCYENKTKYQLVYWGERRSGSNWLFELLKQNLELNAYHADAGLASRSRPWQWKHSCAMSPLQTQTFQPFELQNTLFVTVTKDPYQWLQGFYRKPFISRKRSANFSEFIRAPVHSSTTCMDCLRPVEYDDDNPAAIREHRDTENFWYGCRHHSAIKWKGGQSVCIYGPSCVLDDRNKVPSFTNAVQLWNAKTRSYLALDGVVPHLSHFRYDYLLEHPSQYLMDVSRQHCIPWSNPCFWDMKHHPIRSPAHTLNDWHKTNRNEQLALYLQGGWKEFYFPQKSSHSGSSGSSDVAFINAELDPFVMRSFGFAFLEL